MAAQKEFSCVGQAAHLQSAWNAFIQELQLLGDGTLLLNRGVATRASTRRKTSVVDAMAYASVRSLSCVPSRLLASHEDHPVGA
jgi:hypothetical protein